MADRRVALVTGSARGIGRAIGLDLAAAGWDVATCFRTSRSDAESFCDEAAQLGARTLARQCDVSEASAVETLISETVEELGGIDAVVNAAGPFHRGSVLQETVKGWREMLGGNLDAVFYTSRFAAPHMVERGWGRILTFSLANADRVAGNTGLTAHFVAKLGVQALTRSLARELAPHGITANCISPGFVDTGEVARDEAARAGIPAGRIGHVDDIVAAARFLLSDDASYVNGANLAISGGWGA